MNTIAISKNEYFRAAAEYADKILAQMQKDLPEQEGFGALAAAIVLAGLSGDKKSAQRRLEAVYEHAGE